MIFDDCCTKDWGILSRGVLLGYQGFFLRCEKTINPSIASEDWKIVVQSWDGDVISPAKI